MVIVEAADPVPWTKPADVVYDPQRPLPKLGGLFRDRIQVALMDGSPPILTISDYLRNAIVCDDGKTLGPDWWD